MTTTNVLKNNIFFSFFSFITGTFTDNICLMKEKVNEVCQENRDEILIRAFKDGDKKVFDELVIKYKDKIYNLCYRLMGNAEDADDSAQEAFVKAFKSLKDFRMEASFSTWIYRIAVNECKNKLTSLKHKYSKKTVSIDQTKETERGSIMTEIRDNSISPADEIVNNERKLLVQEEINRLPEDQRAVIVLRDIDGLSYEEIAKITGDNSGTIKSRISRARLRLKDKLWRLTQ